jgi:hypothetical protein
VVGLLALALLAVPASAFGAQRYASPAGSGSGPCAQAAPCSLTYAVEGAAGGDEVLVTAGTYPVAETITSGFALTVRGLPGPSLPLIVAAPKVTPLELDGEVTVAGLAFRATGASGLAATQRGDKLERLDVRVTGEKPVALALGSEETLTDSLLVAEGVEADGLVVFGFTATPSTLRNDTFVASGKGSYGALAISVAPVAFYATNTIAIGEIAATGAEYSGTVTSVDFDHSDLQGKPGERVTSTNAVTAAPVFANAAGGDYREAAGSPTIDAGIDDPANGALDLAGNERTAPGYLGCGAAPAAITDIGAYELIPTAPPCAPPPPPKPAPPGTYLQKATIAGRAASFRFGSLTSPPSGFECKLDAKAWSTCTSPRTYKHLKPGRHTFRVRAFGAGGVDATPVVRKFKIRARHHRHRRHRNR